MLGGSSSINGLVYIRGQPEDFDDWETPGWSLRRAAAVLQEVRGPGARRGRAARQGRAACGLRPERAARAVRRLHRGGGAGRASRATPISTASSRKAPATSSSPRATAGAAQTATAFLRPVLHRANLTVVTEALATKVLFEGTRAVGIRYLKDSKVIEASAQRARSSFPAAPSTRRSCCSSPASGRRALLREHGIAVVLDQPRRRRAPAGPLPGAHRAEVHAADHGQRRHAEPVAHGADGPALRVPAQGAARGERGLRGRLLAHAAGTEAPRRADAFPHLQPGPQWAGSCTRSRASPPRSASCSRRRAARCASARPIRARRPRSATTTSPPSTTGAPWSRACGCCAASSSSRRSRPYIAAEDMPGRAGAVGRRAGSRTSARPAARSSIRPAPPAWAPARDAVVDSHLRVQGLAGPARGGRLGDAGGGLRQHQRGRHRHRGKSGRPDTLETRRRDHHDASHNSLPFAARRGIRFARAGPAEGNQGRRDLRLHRRLRRRRLGSRGPRHQDRHRHAQRARRRRGLQDQRHLRRCAIQDRGRDQRGDAAARAGEGRT